MRKWKRIIGIGILCTLITNICTVQANSMSQSISMNIPTIISVSDTVVGAITETVDANTYEIHLADSGILEIDFKAYLEYYGLNIYDQKGEEVWNSPFLNQWNEQLKFQNNTYNIALEAGTYYIEVNGYQFNDFGKTTGNYQFTTSFVGANETYKGINNDISTASNLVIGKTVKGLIAENDKYDIYKVQLKQSGCLNLNFISYMSCYSIKLYDELGEEVWGEDGNEWKEQTKKRSDKYALDLEEGIYYIEINGNKYGTNISTGFYQFTTKFTSAKATKAEPNNEFSTAKSVKIGEKVVGQIAINDNYDLYKINIKSRQKLMFHMTSYMEHYCINIYDKDGNKVWNTDFNTWDEKLKKQIDKHELTLKKGMYYIEINGYKWSNYSKSTGNYNFIIKKAILPKSIRLNKKNLTLREGSSYQLKAVISPKNTDYKNVTWKSKNSYVAFVDDKGKVFGYNKGTTKIIAYTENNKKYVCKVKVK